MCHQEAYSNVLSDAHSNVSSDAHSNVSLDDTFKRIYSFLNILSSLLSGAFGTFSVNIHILTSYLGVWMTKQVSVDILLIII